MNALFIMQTLQTCVSYYVISANSVKDF